MRDVDSERKGGWQWHNVGSDDSSRGSGIDLWFDGQEVEVVVHSLPDEDNVEEEGLCEILHHLKEDKWEQYQWPSDSWSKGILLFLHGYLLQLREELSSSL